MARAFCLRESRFLCRVQFGCPWDSCPPVARAFGRDVPLERREGPAATMATGAAWRQDVRWRPRFRGIFDSMPPRTKARSPEGGRHDSGSVARKRCHTVALSQGIQGPKAASYIADTETSNHAPQPIVRRPMARLTHCSAGTIFSTRIHSAMTATHSRFMTPATKSKAISNQQHPTQ